MARYLLIALNGPVSAEQEATYNHWYDTIHVPDLEAIEGVVSAERFRILQSNGTDLPYGAAYTIETDDLQKVMADMTNNTRPFDPSFDRTKSRFILAQTL